VLPEGQPDVGPFVLVSEGSSDDSAIAMAPAMTRSLPQARPAALAYPMAAAIEMAPEPDPLPPESAELPEPPPPPSEPFAQPARAIADRSAAFFHFPIDTCAHELPMADLPCAPAESPGFAMNADVETLRIERAHARQIGFLLHDGKVTPPAPRNGADSEQLQRRRPRARDLGGTPVAR
jgi:hypothetical protein